MKVDVENGNKRIKIMDVYFVAFDKSGFDD